MSPGRLTALELFCGIGGCAAALGARARVVAAVDISSLALDTYSHNFPHRTLQRTVEALRAQELADLGAALWWLSPPCQPYTRRGQGRDLEDPRAAGLLHLIRALPLACPTWVALENVPEFGASESCRLLVETLEGAGYSLETLEVCPTSLGIPNRRRRFYLLAGHGVELQPRKLNAGPAAPLESFLDTDPEPSLTVDPELLERYSRAVDRVRAGEAGAITSTFTSAYGRSPVRSGSYLVTPQGVRRFSPAEILRLLGFPHGYRLPPQLTLPQQWRLVGNSLSVAAVRHVLSAIPELQLGQPAPSAA